MLLIRPVLSLSHKVIFTLTICLLTLSTNAQNITSVDLSKSEMGELRAKAQSDCREGNYRDAWVQYKNLLLNGVIESDDEAEALGQDLSLALSCLNNLGEQNQFDNFIEKVIQRYQDQWRILSQAASAYSSVEKTGYIIAGEFQRGYHRGGGRYVNAYQRDRVRALQLYRQAWKKLEQEFDGPTNNDDGDAYNLLVATANVLKQNYANQSWRLQSLTDLDSLPDYEEGYYYQNQLGAPVNADGDIVVFNTPASFEDAVNDGERWRYILQQVAQLNDSGKQWSQWLWADFLWQQYGVQTMAQNTNWYYRQDNNDAVDAEKSIFDLDGLSDDETIAKLATGIQRFSFPAEYNFIAQFEQLTQSASYQSSALERLATIYENRRQLPKAAEYWRKLSDLPNMGRSNHQRYQQRLAQIVGAWAQFEPLDVQAQNKPQKQVGLRFRNASSVKFTARQINSERFLANIKRHLEENPDDLEWEKLNIADIGRQIIEGSTSYRGRILNSWRQSLQPLDNHQDQLISIELPADLRGAYLLEAEVAGGNTNYIVVWNSEAVIVKKPMQEGAFYFVADAYSGKPLANQELNFLGYRQQWLVTDPDNKGRRQREIVSNEFTVKTDSQGQVIVDKEKLDQQYQWLVHTKPKNNEFAFLGFNSVWYGQNRDWQEQQTKAYIITNQPAYRPGQKVELSAWVQTASYNEQNTSSHNNKNYLFRIYNPKGERISEQSVVSDKFGGISHQLQLPDDATLGVYGIEVYGIQGRGQFRVEEYKKPEYEVLIDAPEKPVALGDTIRATVKANYYFGAPVTEAKVKIKIERFTHSIRWYPVYQWDWLYGNGYWWFACDMDWYPGWNDWGTRAPRYSWLGPNYDSQPELIQETELDIGGDGTAEIIINTEMAKLLHGDKDHRYHISVEVVDNSRRSVYGSGDVLVSREPYQVFAWVDKGYYQTGEKVEAHFQAQSLDQKPVQGLGTAELYRLHYDKNGKVTETSVQQWSLNNEASGKAALSFNAKLPGQYRIAYRLEDGQGNRQQGAYVFNVVAVNTVVDSDSYHFNELEIIADRAHYSPGDTLQLMVNSSHDDAHVLLFERPSNTYSKPKPLKLDGNSFTYTLKLDAEDRPNIFVEAVTVHNGEVFSVVKEIAIPPQKSIVNVGIESNKNQYKPGEEAEISLTLTDQNGEPFVGSTVVAVYDKALDYIAAGVKPPPIREYFWQWKRHHQPSMDDSTQLRFYPLVKEENQAMQFIGAFGNRIHQTEFDTEGVIEEIVVTANMRRSRNEDKSMKLEVAAPAPALSIAGFGGEPAEREPQITIRSDFADSAYWISHVVSDEQGKASIKFTMPDNLTTWLTSAWTMGENAQVGQASKELITSKNLLLRLQAPRFFIEKDEVVLSANVHNYLESKQDIKVSLQLDGEEIELIDSENLEQTINLDANGERRVDWRVKVMREGTAKIRMLALSSTTESESDAVEMDFPVYVHGQLITQSFSGALSSKEDESIGIIHFTVPEQRRAEQTRLELRYSPTLAGAMVDALPYLVSFPYGCTEQTLSRFLPTVMVQNILQRSNIDLEAIKNKQSNLNAQEIGDDKERAQQWRRYHHNPVFDKDKVSTMSRAGLDRLNTMQFSDGGWGWFSGWGETSSPHTTAYVVHGMQIAKATGLAVDENSLQRGIQWLLYYQAQELQKLNNADSKTQPYKTNADNLDAFVGMVLTDSGNPSTAIIDLLYRDRLKLSLYGQSMLGLTLDAVDRAQERDMVRRNIEQYLVVDDENQTAYLNLGNSNYWWYWYGSEYEAQAYYLKLLAKLEPKGETAPRLVKYLLNNRKHANYWNSTRDTAIVVEAMSDYLIASGEASPDISLDIKLDGKSLKTVELSAENLFNFDNKLVIEGLDLSAGEHRLEIVKTGSGPLYYNAYVNNFSLEDKLEKQGLELKVERRYYKLTPLDASTDVAGSLGQAIKQKVEKYQRAEISEDTELDSGDLVEIELLIDSKNDYEYILIEDMKAAGFEPITVQSGYDGNDLGAYVEYRDNRVAFFVQRLARGSHSLSYRMKAEIPGQFSALPTKVEAMYAPELKANSDENKLLITE